MSIALQYRNQWHKDALVDLIAYRRHGHNELDEPAFTQPQMYRCIGQTPSVAQKYSEHLTELQVIEKEQADKLREAAWKRLDEALSQKEFTAKPMSFPVAKVKPLKSTGVSLAALKEAGLQSVEMPANFNLHPRLVKHHVEARKEAILEKGQVDWATAEAMAFGTMMKEGYWVRLSGQDVGRGTFSQRHLQLHDQQTGKVHQPFDQMELVGSPLSEMAVMGFEYGSSVANPTGGLTIWEAQFGDFFNGAQIILDTMISSGETKWALPSNLCLLLPHGYDGAGPEHSSCRLERHLQQANEPTREGGARTDGTGINWRVCNPTTPANYFHLLRRQLTDPPKPVIVASPKTLLRLPACQSRLEEMAEGTLFQPVLDDPQVQSKDQVNHVILVTGKLYYELVKNAAHPERAFIRLEELAPFPWAELKKVLTSYPKATRFTWCQEEPQNMGAYSYVMPRLQQLIPKFNYVGRLPAAAPAVGYSQRHKAELESLFKAL